MVGLVAGGAMVLGTQSASANVWYTYGFTVSQDECDYIAQQQVDMGTATDYYCTPRADGGWWIYLFSS